MAWRMQQMQQQPLQQHQQQQRWLCGCTPAAAARRARNRSSSSVAAAAAACRTRPAVSCRTVVQLAGPDDVQLVLSANDLVAETFYASSPNPLVDAVSFNSYRLRSASQTLGQHMHPGRSHATIVALAQPHREPQAAAGAASSSRGGPQAAARRRDGGEQRAVGVVNVSVMRASGSISRAAGCEPGAAVAMVTNMCVVPELRRQGVAHALMEAALRACVLQLDEAPQHVLLLAYKYYEPAVRLYEGWGFRPTPWEDPLWLEDAQKGRTGRQRRLLMVRQLSGPGLLAPQHPAAAPGG